ncbi:MAG TPA: hypothetical protein VMZ90_13595 [Vicinamibacterales bacterium]|nr:hypothetical protein [Vicinamibacterales bacterium]
MADLADYCRQVEAHLTRVNGGHLVRVVGPGFALVRQWADEGVPLSVVFRGIEDKAGRHAAGASKRPLRIEFCEADVRALYDDWRRAIGVPQAAPADADSRQYGTASAEHSASPKRRSAPKAIDRAIERLGRLAGRLELPEEFRDAMSRLIEQLSALREELAHSRGAVREQLLERLAPLEGELLDHARGVVPADVMRDIKARAEQDLATYRERLSPDAWSRAIAVTVDRGVRDHLELPSLDL